LLADRGILRRCYSQNIDSLERAAGVPADRIVAAHGNFDGAHAWIQRALGQVERGAKVPIDELKQAVHDGAEALLQLNAKYGGLVKVRAHTAVARAPHATLLSFFHECAFRRAIHHVFVRRDLALYNREVHIYISTPTPSCYARSGGPALRHM
jgi:hypothetical protein